MRGVFEYRPWSVKLAMVECEVRRRMKVKGRAWRVERGEQRWSVECWALRMWVVKCGGCRVCSVEKEYAGYGICFSHLRR